MRVPPQRISTFAANTLDPSTRVVSRVARKIRENMPISEVKKTDYYNFIKSRVLARSIDLGHTCNVATKSVDL